MSFNDYVINIIVGRAIIGGLYDAVTNARRICSIGGKFNYTFTLEEFGSKRYSMCELIKFDEEFRCISLDEILTKEEITLDDMVIILLKGRNEFRNLYASFYRAENAISNAKVLCYTFKNPYTGQKKQYNASQVLNLFSQIREFDPQMIIE